MSIQIALVARVTPSKFTTLLSASIDAGRSLLESVRESFEGSFVERPLRVVAADVPAAVRALGLPRAAKVAESRVDGTTIELLLAGRLDHRATVADALRAMERAAEDASFSAPP